MASSNRSSKFASFVLGVVFGMGICAGAAYFLTTGPLPFVDKVDKVTADVDPAEALAGGVDPNQKLNQSPDEMTAAGSESPVDTIDAIVKRVTAGSSDAGPARDASGKAVAPGQVKTATLWVQAGAFKSQDRAQNMQAQLAMFGIQADLSRAGNVWRVRVGPFDTTEQAREIQEQIRNADDSIGTSIVEN